MADRRPALRHIPLADLVDGSIIDGKTLCPFHDDSTPSCHIYNDHYHCFACGAHGDQIDWLTKTKGLERAGGDPHARDLDGSTTAPQQRPRLEEKAERTAAALRLWAEAQPIAGTLAAVYLSRWRKLELAGLPTDVDATLRFHPNCPFGPGTRHPCLRRADAGSGHRRRHWDPARRPGAGRAEARPPHARALRGRQAVASSIDARRRRGASRRCSAPLRASPTEELCCSRAWAVLHAIALARFPVVLGVRRLILLVDRDENGVGQAAGMACTERWRRAGVTVIRLTPKRVRGPVRRHHSRGRIMNDDCDFADLYDEEILEPDIEGRGVGL